MSDNETEKAGEKSSTEISPGDITDFIVVLTAHDKGRAQLKASKLLAQCVEAAHVTGKKGGTVTVKATVTALESGAVGIEIDVDGKPVEESVKSIWFDDGEGHLSRDNAGMFYGIK